MKTRDVIILCAVAYGLYSIYAYANGLVSSLTSALAYPFQQLAGLASATTAAESQAYATLAAPGTATALDPFAEQSVIDTSQASDEALSTMNSNDYAPGGTIYNEIQAQQGTAAANAAYTTEQNNLATQESQTPSTFLSDWL